MGEERRLFVGMTDGCNPDRKVKLSWLNGEHIVREFQIKRHPGMPFPNDRERRRLLMAPNPHGRGDSKCPAILQRI